ncbi:MAG: circularly permuted type 2 ATP-grasp protein [Magnetococcales bacterium]|nr:circularly permuted type 2 ATP-grasp protein [Magnetococcales bacterium]NGZ27397.1 circularly permuted type 2 ATP-grasp protein [Magnetococcales bacterium]
MNLSWQQYPLTSGYDELISVSGAPRPEAAMLCHYLEGLGVEALQQRQRAAEQAIVSLGITFTIYSEGDNIDRAWPFDIIPRLLPASEWQLVTQGLIQRITAINQFIGDLYGERRIIREGVFPEELLHQSKNYRPQCEGMKPAWGAWAHICGSDLVRDDKGVLRVLEDNLRVPSGVSYMLENRMLTKRVFPELFGSHRILPVDDYPAQLYETLAALSPRPGDHPRVVLLTPGIYNSAYFEHVFLAQNMGIELVEGRDLAVGEDECVYMKTVSGLERVDVIYRRVDDMFLDPEVFHPDSTLGVAGLIRAWRKGNVAIANAPGAGVADDKVVYAYMPDIIKFYLGEEAIIPNVPTYKCLNQWERSYVLEHLDNLVVKPANESGGYGMIIGPMASKEEREAMAQRVKEDPRNYIAQPVITLSTVPTLTTKEVAPRHVDLRPFILQSRDTYVTAGGLTRVALRQGSLVVNSSQGGGSKDTWVVDLEV